LYEIRNAILGLSPTNITELGLPGALEKLINDFSYISRIPADLRVSGTVRRSSSDTENALYHICQESLYNVFKHAHAQRVEVGLVFEPEATLLMVTDDGIGVDRTAPERERSAVTFGLRNMKARAEELGGSLSLSQGEGEGTRVAARIPGPREP
jgi:signal transduction histidine kinase